MAPKNWSGILSNNNMTKICWQTSMYQEYIAEQVEDPRQNEDCLYINVYTPSVSTLINRFPSFKMKLLLVSRIYH